MNSNKFKFLIFCTSIIFILFSLCGHFFIEKLFSNQNQAITKIFNIPSVNARGQYYASGGVLRTGTEAAITSGAATGNTGSWKGTLTFETAPGLNWTINSNASTGISQLIYVDGVSRNGGNKILIQIAANAGLATLLRSYQICDWVSSDYADNLADGDCPGGWRTMNKTNGTTRVGIGETTARNYTWHLYDGYWTTTMTGNTPVPTPISNFISSDANKRILIRAYSPSAISTTHIINWVGVEVLVDPIYYPAAFTKISGGTVSTSYINAENPVTLYSGSNATGSDNVYLTVPGTASAISDFYLSFNNVKTYSGANTIVVAAEYSCSTTGISHQPKIYNFTTSSWEPIGATAITCSATDATARWAINNINLSNYISNGEIRIGWYGSAVSTVGIRLDYIYVIVGSTNDDPSQCEISFGTGTATDCVNTRTLDTRLASPSTWQQTSELESATFGHDYYAYDNDADATTGEAASSANLNLPMALSANTANLGYVFSANWRSNATTTTTQGQLRDWSGSNGANGGWTLFGATNAATTYTYEDSIINGYFTSNCRDYLNGSNNVANVRFRTTASTATANITRDIDFVFMSLRWAEGLSSGTLSTDIVDSGGNSVSNPSISMSNINLSFGVQNTTGFFGVDNQRIRVSNSTGNPQWSLSLAAQNGPTSLWSTGSLYYDFNDSTASAGDGGDTDSYGGQMTINPSIATITPQGGCSSTGISLGSLSSFIEGSANSITLVTSGSSSGTSCYWDFTGLGVSQSIPGEQPVGNYSINMMLSIVAN
jgi:hypothetical protein